MSLVGMRKQDVNSKLGHIISECLREGSGYAEWHSLLFVPTTNTHLIF